MLVRNKLPKVQVKAAPPSAAVPPKFVACNFNSDPLVPKILNALSCDVLTVVPPKTALPPDKILSFGVCAV